MKHAVYSQEIYYQREVKVIEIKAINQLWKESTQTRNCKDLTGKYKFRKINTKYHILDGN